MEPKEKAKELVFKYQNLVTTWDCYNDEPRETKFRLEDMKKCALICIDEKIETLLPYAGILYVKEEVEELEEVKQEINRL
tara:strand:+ start:206 stop:445 length:240 start_codon:yes stop_codon:yes gene_type:complete